MGTLYLVRHSQASFAADDYDQLSELGHRQSVLLGEYFRHKGVRFDAALVGTLRRHIGTLEGIVEGLQMRPDTLSWPGLNEYDSTAVLAAVHPEPLTRPDSPEQARQHFRLLREGLQQWMAGTLHPVGMPSYVDFAAGVKGALDHVRLNHHEQNVLIVSSGGPISTAIGQVLGMDAHATIELNLRMRNSSISEFVFTPKRHMLQTFNTLPHLDHPDQAKWITYA